MKQSNSFKFRRLTEYTNDSIITEIKRVVSILNPVDKITIEMFKKYSDVSLSTIRRHFGSWRGALKISGYGYLYNDSKKITDKMRHQYGKNMSDDELIALLKKISTKLCKTTITLNEFDSHAPISSSTIRKRFGGWGKALMKAGLFPQKVQKRYTNEECFENLFNVWTYYGRPPKSEEMSLSPSVIGIRAYLWRWGTWNKVLKTFVQKMEKSQNDNKTISNDSSNDQPTIKSKRRQNYIPDSEKHKIKLSLRYYILKRDKFKCVLCGRSPATTPELELQVDHIIPFSKGGKTLIDNLQTTCRECNLGKGTN